MKKGFTLIELLAVIVILAIIALIATPLILNVIDDAQKGAFQNTAYGIIEAAELTYARDVLSGNNNETIFTYNEGIETSNVNGKKLEYKGERPESGNVYINEKGKIAIIIYNGKYCAEKNFDESEVRMTNKTKETCQIPESFECGDTLFDTRDGQAYATVEIGDQCWMAENLRYTGNGCLNKAWDSDDFDACKMYNANSPSIDQGSFRSWTGSQIYYQWNALMNGSRTAGSQGACPTEWHVPTDLEWQKLEGNVDTEYEVGSEEWEKTSYRGYDAGDNLRSSVYWDGNDTHGFNLLPCGYVNTEGSPEEIGYSADLWTSTIPESYFTRGISRYIASSRVYREESWFKFGSVARCILD